MADHQLPELEQRVTRFALTPRHFQRCGKWLLVDRIPEGSYRFISPTHGLVFHYNYQTELYYVLKQDARAAVETGSESQFENPEFWEWLNGIAAGLVKPDDAAGEASVSIPETYRSRQTIESRPASSRDVNGNSLGWLTKRTSTWPSMHESSRSRNNRHVSDARSGRRYAEMVDTGKMIVDAALYT